MAVSAMNILTHVLLHRMTYNKKSNLSGLLGVTATSEMVLPAMKEVMLTAARKVDPNFLEETGDQKWHRACIHIVEPEQ